MTDNTPSVRPEAGLETLLTAALAQAFRGLPRSRFQNQKRFKVRLGHEETPECRWEAKVRQLGSPKPTQRSDRLFLYGGFFADITKGRIVKEKMKAPCDRSPRYARDQMRPTLI